MKNYKGVTSDEKPQLREINYTTLYLRNNIRKVHNKELERDYYVYDEEQYEGNEILEYLDNKQIETDQLLTDIELNQIQSEQLLSDLELLVLTKDN